VTVRVISVGKSILVALDDLDRLKALNLSPDLIKVIARWRPQDALADAGADAGGDAASNWLQAAIGGPAAAAAGPPASQFAALAATVRPDLWPAGLSAELDTFSRVEGAIPLLPSDVAVLICSDTPVGLLAGAWNAVALAGGDLARITYLAGPGAGIGSVRGRILLVRVKGLDAARDSDFRDAMKGLGTLGRSLLTSSDIGPDDGFRFYLSGGFKAAIPYLIGLAEGMRSAPGNRAVDAYVLHETGGSGAIRLPLRRMIASQVAEELSRFDEHTGISEKLPKPALLNGYAYESDGASYRLTPFGAGLRALFPLPPEQLRP
jgi:hypothetical protein